MNGILGLRRLVSSLRRACLVFLFVLALLGFRIHLRFWLRLHENRNKSYCVGRFNLEDVTVHSLGLVVGRIFRRIYLNEKKN
jgi:hypothetical protein